MAMATIFAKPIDRPIEGVIKADDEASLRTEVEEYVLTNEVAKRLEEFLAAYTSYAGANGVWISGFFGSGKSHLLKMLALLLENRSVDGVSVLDLFLQKEEVKASPLLRAEILRAVAIPSNSILFNIDQKADVISKAQIDALLAVFVKVFDEFCGYYGKQGHIAQFERDLDSRGQLAAFKEAYRTIARLEWERGREQALLEGPHIARAYAQVTGAPPASAENILDKYRSQYKMSIEDFADQVNEYIQRRGRDFRLNFFVDEVGQYIADNVKLMTNLQTIAESLATKSRGRAWLIVTAQEDMTDVIGEMTQQQGNDFSKIQARFANRMKLTSADVAEVIRRRLLFKNEAGVRQLADLYAHEQNNFRTLFDFADGSFAYRNFRDRDEFIETYPFVPYQFPLFQSAIRQLSLHNAFEGRHRSVGERSMLDVFQHAAMALAQQQLGTLATFDLLFEGIRTTLKTQIQSAILTAEDQLPNPFAVKVLKALFLVKYVKEFKATLRNLMVLMLPHFDADLPALRRNLEEALGLLEQHTYIQRNGELYEYLTNEEKDVEEEIKSTEIESSAVAEELEKLVFDQVIKERKIRYPENNQDYPFARKIDGRLMGREYELAIHLISPDYEHSDNLPILRAHAMGRDELVVALPASERLLRELLMYERTDKYIRQHLTATQSQIVRQILTAKQAQNHERFAALRRLLTELLGQAILIVGGQDLDLSGQDGQARVVRGFHELIVRTYPNLRMLRGVTYTEQQIARYLQQSTSLLGSDEATFSEAEQEMAALIQSNQRNGLRTTLQTLVNTFERKPYGWYLAAIQCVLAKLCARGKVELRRDGNLLSDQELEHALRNTRGFDNVVLDPQIDFTAAQVRQLKEFHAEFFDGPPRANEAKALAQETVAAFQNFQQEIARLQAQSAGYPFHALLAAAATRLQAVTGKPYAFYLTELRSHEDDLFTLKERTLDPLRRFLNGTQRQIYDEARQYLTAQEANFSYVDGDEAHQLQAILADHTCYNGTHMTRAKSLLDALQARVGALVHQEKAATLGKIDERWHRLAGMAEFTSLTPDQQRQLQQPFDELKRTVERQTLIAVIRDTLYRFDERTYQTLLRQMTTWAQPVPAPHAPYAAGNAPARPIAEPPIEYVTQRALPVPFDKPWLADEQDVDHYLAALKQALLQAIHDGKRIQLP
jgi:hypothetical protein